MIHSKYLAATSGGLQIPPAISTTPSEVVSLTEPSEILDLLFRFVHPRSEADNFRQSSVMNMASDTFFPLAEAAEKYQVFGAINTCFTRLDQLIKQHPIEVLNHSHRHGYLDIADQAAIETIALPLDKITKGLTHPGLLQQWLLHYIHWRNLAAFGSTLLDDCPSPTNGCTVWPKIKTNYFTAVMGNLWGNDFVLDCHQQPCTAREPYGHRDVCRCSNNIQEAQKKITLEKLNIPNFRSINI
ncbi:hypothetical protein HYPSUDRAFT_72587 [Hypholoma sublateritium FD-334 SS-4]|uniref:BTB domain-containing protein n=1 Tax=Hypholoma sublateritium (strain FD-334 SS-4) TaxID=945553 RepID=A0A0D2NCX3_HYPSF|nr:hypothetical protein HYPSUDRAFT_72587 [Hypholoma sublateritium FD-334 SS-4]